MFEKLIPVIAGTLSQYAFVVILLLASLFILGIACAIIAIAVKSLLRSTQGRKKTKIGDINKKITNEVYQQLDSTYEDSPINGEDKEVDNVFCVAAKNILTRIGLINNDSTHDDITIKVYRRLLLRHSLLNAVERMSYGHDAIHNDNITENGILTKTALQSLAARNYINISGTKENFVSEFNNILNGDQPRELTLLTQSTTHAVNASVGGIDDATGSAEQPYMLLPAKLRAYNLAVTDLFVEKALSYLNRKARTYNKYGYLLSCVALFSILFGTLVALSSTFDNNTSGAFANFVKTHFIDKYKAIDDSKQKNAVEVQKSHSSLSHIPVFLQNYINDLKDSKISPYISQSATENLTNFISSDQANSRWIDFISAFVKGFTFYGLLVLLAVFCYRMAKALFDQAERLKDRRHALRQGRLFVHLNGGKMSVDELEKAFNWNMSSENAFANINPDAQAPWGNVVKEMLRTIRETSKAGIKAAERK
jgi:hypothetical protein